jgi:hypothetical protein
MNLKGRRIHIVGSADVAADTAKLQYAHTLISKLVTALAQEGASFVVPFGKEPFMKDRSDGPSIIFDWTVIESVYQALNAGFSTATGTNGRLISTLATGKTDSQIPANRREIYEKLRDASAIQMDVLEPGWTAGALQRQRLAQLGDVLIAISGGQGVEQLAIEYSTKGKAVIPLDINVGSSQRDGSGGASRLFDKALAQPSAFIRVIAGESPAELLERTRTRNGETDIDKVVAALMNLLHKLAPPRVFYVRLLNDKIPENASVEAFFRNTVDKLVLDLGYEPLQMGMGKNEFAWMNKAIFDSLHHSSVVLIDLTALRPNCFMELGYALGNMQRVIVTARSDTHISFDAHAIEAFLWNEAENPADRLEKLRKHWERNINMPHLVEPKEAK